MPPDAQVNRVREAREVPKFWMVGFCFDTRTHNGVGDYLIELNSVLPPVVWGVLNQSRTAPKTHIKTPVECCPVLHIPTSILEMSGRCKTDRPASIHRSKARDG